MFRHVLLRGGSALAGLLNRTAPAARPSLVWFPHRCSSSTASFALDGLLGDLGLATHEEMHRFSVERPGEFWGRVARSRLRWDADFGEVMRCDMNKAKFEWFAGGKLNASGIFALGFFSHFCGKIRGFCIITSELRRSPHGK